MEKIIQEFRIIETDDGFRIEIKGDKEQLREFVMSLDPRHWVHSRRPEWGPPPFGPRIWKMRAGHGGWGPFGFAWGCCEDDEEEGEHPHHRHRHHHPEHGNREADSK